VNGENVDEIAEAIKRVLGDDAMRGRLEAGALRHAQANSWANRVRIFQDLCRKLQQRENTMSEPRTLLVIAGEFPPLKTIGRIRTVKFVDQLRSMAGARSSSPSSPPAPSPTTTRP
jgi:hypothetical protein